jgi:hypothetical protein
MELNELFILSVGKETIKNPFSCRELPSYYNVVWRDEIPEVRKGLVSYEVLELQNYKTESQPLPK